MKTFCWLNSCTEAVLITDELHEKLISFASHVYDPYSIQIDSKPSLNTNYLIWRMLRLNPFSEQIRCMSNANTQISSLAFSHVNRLCHRMTTKRLISTLLGGLNQAYSPYSAQLRCKLFVIKRNSSLVKVLILTNLYAVKW